ncbi:unnamed protein product [Arabis nemorensis]|uniref:MADS-box domain-containing protein n=1 Tax=Arabis nemorensis TaxID=586526 RepID=A0A565AZG5_9BRAS|nr:unnamed protein product [Arabis nemorensis]
MSRSKVKLLFIANEQTRKITFKKRKKGLIKKLDELVKLCDVKACGIISSPYESTPDAWPSREGVDEVVSKFKELPMNNQIKKMVDQGSFMRQTISKEKEKLHKLYVENRESQVRDFMFGCLQGKAMEYQFDKTDVKDLRIFMRRYLDKLTHRIETLEENGESSYSLPPLVVADGNVVAAPIGFYDQIQYQNVNQNQQDMTDAHIPSMDGIHHQASTASHLSSIATAVADVCAPNITKGLKLKGIAFE